MVEEAQRSKFNRANVKVDVGDFGETLAVGSLLTGLDNVAVALPAGGGTSVALWLGLVAFYSSYYE